MKGHYLTQKQIIKGLQADDVSLGYVDDKGRPNWAVGYEVRSTTLDKLIVKGTIEYIPLDDIYCLTGEYERWNNMPD